MLQSIFAISIALISLNLALKTNGQHLPLCDLLNESEGNDHDPRNSEVKVRRVRALCDAIHASRDQPAENELDAIPDFDLAQLQSGE